MNVLIDIERASTALSEGKFLECADICGAILAAQPRNAVAAHLLGLALKDSGDWTQGEAWMRLSIEIEPARAEFQTNLANLLRKQGDYIEAKRLYRRALRLLPNHSAARRSLALTLNDLNRHKKAEIECQILITSDPSDAEAWSILGLVLTNQGRFAEAEAAYKKAIALDPTNKIARHNLGALLSRMEKPEAAIEALDTAVALGAEGYEVAFNKGRALLDIYDVDSAERELERAVNLQPTNAEAQLTLTRVRYMRGDPKFARSLATAIAIDRSNVELQLLFGQVLWRSGNLVAAETVMQDLLKRQGANPQVQAALSRILHETGNLKEAETQALDAATAAPNDADVIESLVSILLSRGRAADAIPFIEAQRRKWPGSQAWIAYEATAARALGQEKYYQLYDYDRLIQVFNIETPSGWSSMIELNQALVTTLNNKHRFSNHPLDQTLHNGTQTARSLLSDSDPAIKAIITAFEAPIEQYRQTLGQQPDHPLSSRNFGKTEFTGAWSVRLRCQGFHINHFHPDGWLSSAYYVDVPQETIDIATKSGWIKFGEPRYKIPGLKAERFVQPRAGQLVLFPSYMWHGTNAIHGNEPRMSIAFDVRPIS